MKLKRFLPAFCALLCVFSRMALAQYTIGHMVFRGSTPYSQTDLEAATGLKVGTQISSADLQTSAQRLMDTGAFDDVQATLAGSVKSVNVIFDIKPAAQSGFLFVGFENFVWWQPDALISEVHRRVPLFHGSVPEAGNQQQAVLDALKQMLAEKGIAAAISSNTVESGPGHPERSLNYRIDTPDIRIRSIHLSGVSASMSPAVNKVTDALAGQRYREGIAGKGAIDSILAVYRNAGYLDASLGQFDRSITMADPQHVELALSATVNEGDVYRVSALEWPGSPLITSKDFNDAAKLHAGDIASQAALLASLLPIDLAYRRQGYIDVGVDTARKLDTTTHRVAYSISVNPGRQFHMGKLEIANATDEQRAQIAAAWKMHAGDPFDQTYIPSFLSHNWQLLPSLNGYSGAWKQTATVDTQIVDVVVTLVKGGPLMHQTITVQ